MKTYIIRLLLILIIASFVRADVVPIDDYDFDKYFGNFTNSSLDPLNMTATGALPYTEVMGNIFWGFLFGGIFLMMWMRQEDVILPAIVGIIIGASIWSFMPPDWLQLAQSLVIVSLAGLIYSIIYGRR